MKTNVVLVDDHASIRQMLALVLVNEGPYEIAGEAGTGFEALKLGRKVRPRLVVLDLTMPEMNGIEVLRVLRKEMQETRVLVYSGTQSREMIVAALQSRPHGFVHKSDSLPTFCEALRAVVGGCLYLTPLATRLLDEVRDGATSWSGLTERERAILQMVAEGMSNKTMADRLAVSPKTVEHHRAHLMQKLNLHDVAHLTRYAVRLGVVPAAE